jgi:hypothetical protein
MTDFLTFLNTADLDILTQIPGVSRATAGNIIAARPFDFVEDCANVKGVSKNLLGKMQSYFEEELNESRNSAMITVEQEPLPAVIEKSQPIEEPVKKDEPSFFSRLGKALASFIRALIRLILIVALIVIIGAGLYYGLPYINRTFIAPVEQNTFELRELQSQVNDMQTQVAEMTGRLESIDDSVEAHSASLEKLEGMQATLETQLEENHDKTLLELKHEVMMTRVLDMLGRARLYLAQSNFGLAKEDVQSARDLLADLQTEKDDEVFDLALQRLGLALGNLPEFPVIAAGDLEIAWQILVTGKPANIVTATPTPFVEPFLTTSPTANAIESATPTPFDVPSVTPTP